MGARAALVALLGLLLAAALPTAPAVTAAPVTAPAATGHLIVGLRRGAGFDDADAPTPRLATSQLFGPAVQRIAPLGDGAFQLDLGPTGDPAAVAAGLLRQPAVRYAEPDYLLTSAAMPAPFTGQPSDPAWRAQEEMRRIDADRAWTITTGSPDVIIAFLDSGVLPSHVDFTGKLLPGYDFLADRPGGIDDNGHGTFTAALAAGQGNNEGGIAGVCWGCRVLPLKILDRRGLGPVSAFSRAMRYAVERGARIVNVSASVTTSSTLMRDAVADAIEQGVLIVAAAGNEGSDRPMYPAAFDRVLAVGATDRTDRFAPLSSFGAFVDLVAPGVAMTTASIAANDATTVRDGTSMSAPLVTGAAGLLLSVRSDLSVDGLTNLLTETAVDLGPRGRDDRFGHGRLSVYDAVLVAASPPTVGGAELALVTTSAPSRIGLAAIGLDPTEKLRVWAPLVDGHYLFRRDLTTDATGRVTASLDLDCNAPAGPYRLTVAGDRSARVATAAATIIEPPARACFQPLTPRPSTDERLFFADTRHTLSGGFRTYWEERGGIPIFGYPISEEFRELNVADGRTYTVQYFERARFEYHPEHKATEYEVELGLLDRLLTAGRAFPSTPAGVETATRRFFPETQHSLSNEFLTYWDDHGGLALFGYPISEPALENGWLTQHFQRARFELHPDPPAPAQVLLGHLGIDAARRAGYLP
ncbi:MAG: S8 family serine peptidase [Chloroflexi bacterium]|nr:S8 family serine peptidase [Chloroflexota bacterium]